MISHIITIHPLKIISTIKHLYSPYNLTFDYFNWKSKNILHLNIFMRALLWKKFKELKYVGINQ
jgi:hypothetical protein